LYVLIHMVSEGMVYFVDFLFHPKFLVICN
jgi:hypothetical protein